MQPITMKSAPLDSLRLGPIGSSERRSRAAAGASIVQNRQVYEEAPDGPSAPGRESLDGEIDG